MAKFDEWSGLTPTTALSRKIAEFDRVRRNRENLEETEKALMDEILSEIGDHEHTHVEGKFIIRVGKRVRRTVNQRAAIARYGLDVAAPLPSYFKREVRYGVIHGEEVDPTDADLVQSSITTKIDVSVAEEEPS